MIKAKDHPALFDGGMMRVGGYADKVAAQGPPLQSVPLRARRSAPGLGEYVETGVFGEVAISAEYATEAEARTAGYTFDAAAYARDRFGGIEPPAWKVLARDTDFVHKTYCIVEGK